MSGDLQNTSQKPTGKKAKKLSQKEQSARFIETAKSLETNESVEDFQNTLEKVLMHNPKKLTDSNR